MDPFYKLSSKFQLTILVALLIAMFGSFLAIAATNQPLENEVAPLGILSLQFAGELSAAASILNSWGETARLYAAFNLGLDYLFLVVYSLVLSLACSWLARTRQPNAKGFSTTGYLLAWAIFAAAVLDVVENIALWQLLLGSMNVQWPKLATLCATLKFSIILVGVGYIVIGLLTLLRPARQ